MLYSGTDSGSYITEYTFVYHDNQGLSAAAVERTGNK